MMEWVTSSTCMVEMESTNLKSTIVLLVTSLWCLVKQVSPCCHRCSPRMDTKATCLLCCSNLTEKTTLFSLEVVGRRSLGLCGVCLLRASALKYPSTKRPTEMNSTNLLSMTLTILAWWRAPTLTKLGLRSIRKYTTLHGPYLSHHQTVSCDFVHVGKM